MFVILVCDYLQDKFFKCDVDLQNKHHLCIPRPISMQIAELLIVRPIKIQTIYANAYVICRDIGIHGMIEGRLPG